MWNKIKQKEINSHSLSAPRIPTTTTWASCAAWNGMWFWMDAVERERIDTLSQPVVVLLHVCVCVCAVCIQVQHAFPPLSRISSRPPMVSNSSGPRSEEVSGGYNTIAIWWWCAVSVARDILGSRTNPASISETPFLYINSLDSFHICRYLLLGVMRCASLLDLDFRSPAQWYISR